MKKHVRLLLVILIEIAVLSVYGKGNSKRVLILNSYNQGLSWTDSLNRGFTETLKESVGDVSFFVEFLDTKRNKTSISKEQISYIVWRIKQVKPHIIAITDDDAFLLIKKLVRTEDGFDTIPMVFMGVNQEQEVPSNFTGIFEKVDIKSNFELIKNLKPETSKVYCVVDNTTTGKVLHNQIDSLLLTYYPKFDVEIIWDCTYNELFDKVSKLNNTEAILFLLFNQDKNGYYFSYEEILDSINHHTSAPIFGTWSFYLNHGIIGGNIISGIQHGKRAGKIAELLLNKATAKAIESSIGPSSILLDYSQLEKFNISKDLIPSNAIIINQPTHSFTIPENALYFTILVIILLAALIVFLLSLFKSKQKNLRLQQYYNTILEQKNKEVEESLRIAENANRLKTAFLANMSHEIRTPMNSIVGFSRVIKDTPNLTSEEVYGYLDIITENAQQLLRLINDIIDISKIDSKQLTIYKRPVQLGSLFANCYSAAEMERDRLGKNNILIEMSFSPADAAMEIVTDPDRLNQLIMNLMNNAIKFTNNGKIVLSYALVQNLLRVTVEDSGIGLKSEDVDKIFNRFTQLDGSLTREYGGSGLGLSICKGIVEAMNGRIGVDSTHGKGSKFWFELPVRFPKEGETNIETPSQPTKSKLKNKILLIVEDNKPSALLLKEMLKGTGAVILHASTGKEVQTILKDKINIDVALVDIYLPDISGLELIPKIKKAQPQVKIITQTANAMDSDKKKAEEAGCDEYITKPIDKDELILKINNLL
ncbi:ATP-binding protein [Tenuifilum thalassicum]|uniref:histidine kinase n=1 Tax=Tenuifilum thalassicum TaxID=2590900 RepID=A0A7D3XKT0_9BACT|nr:ATP-binding protein [Tenuifilum thalassicum]QKG78836.1 response regulator [Tenuifilum thalassicum]